MELQELDLDAVRSLYELVGEDRELFDELVAEFRDQGPQRIAELGRAMAAGDSAVASRAAHTLKTNSATFGATELASLSRRLEEAARRDELAAAAGLLDDVERSWALVSRDLESLAHGALG
jgi:histidine phosphotransfer protein HptB